MRFTLSLNGNENASYKDDGRNDLACLTGKGLILCFSINDSGIARVG